MDTLEIQRRLAARGFDPGPIDGVRGRLTIRATKAFQSANGLAADGIVRARTRAVLTDPKRDPPHPPVGQARPAPSPARGEGSGADLPWYDEAVRLKGLREAAGGADNRTILSWARRLKLAYSHDATPWCGLFVAHCIAAALPDEPLPTNPLGAQNWIRFGAPVDPTLGAVLVFWRKSRASGLGHVGFYAGEDASAFHVLGGNQSDEVSVARISRARLIGARWPTTAPRPHHRAAMTAGGGELSFNEA